MTRQHRASGWVCALIAASVAACGDDDGAATDASVLDAADDVSTIDAAEDANVSDAALDATTLDAANDDAGVALDAASTDADDTPDAQVNSLWPDLDRLDVDDAIASSTCGVDWDQSNDGSIEQRWDYELTSEGHVSRIVRRSGNDASIYVYDQQQRLHATCGTTSCRVYSYSDQVTEQSVFDVPAPCQGITRVDAPNAGTQVTITHFMAVGASVPHNQRVFVFDSAGRLDHVILFGQPPAPGNPWLPSSHQCVDTNGRLARERHLQSKLDWTYFDNGAMQTYDADTATATLLERCDIDGWEIENKQTSVDDTLWGWRYDLERDSNQRITGGDLHITPEPTAPGVAPVTQTFRIRFTWDQDGHDLQVHFDPSGPLTSIHELSPSPALADAFTYDSEGNVTRVDRDTDRNGNLDQVDVYTYRGSSHCRDGSNRHLQTLEPGQLARPSTCRRPFPNPLELLAPN